MDPRKFDELVQKLSQTVSRRSMVGGTVGASVLTAVGLGSGDAGDEALAKGNKGKKHHRAHGQGNGGHKHNAHGQGNGGNKHRGGAKGEGGKGRGGAHAEACIPTGKKCPSKKPRGRKAKHLGCNRCCQGHFTVNSNGRNKCACQPEGLACQTTTECCTGVCSGGLCITLS